MAVLERVMKENDTLKAEIAELKAALQKVLDDSVIGVVPKSHLDHIEKLLIGN